MLFKSWKNSGKNTEWKKTHLDLRVVGSFITITSAMSPNLEKYSLRPSVKWKNAAFRNTKKKRFATQVESFWKIAFSAERTKRGHTSWPKSTKPFPLFAFQRTLESKVDTYICKVQLIGTLTSLWFLLQHSENDSALGSPIWSCRSIPTLWWEITQKVAFHKHCELHLC